MDSLKGDSSGSFLLAEGDLVVMMKVMTVMLAQMQSPSIVLSLRVLFDVLLASSTLTHHAL